MNVKPMSLAMGALAGLLVTVVVTLVWPKNKLRWLRPLLSAGLGFAVAYLIMQMV
jgi:hypothetical protein